MMRLPQELKGRVLDYLDLEAIMIKGGISRSFRAARACVESISWERKETSFTSVGHWRTALPTFSGARRLSVDCVDDDIKFGCVFAALEREPFRARCLEVRIRVHVALLDGEGLDDNPFSPDTPDAVPQLGRLLPLLHAGGLPALEVFDFEVYDDNCVHTGDVALWPPQPRLKVHPTVRAKLLQILDALPARVAVRSALALGAPADGILARIDAASVDLNESNAHMDPCVLCWARRPGKSDDAHVGLLPALVARGLAVDARGPRRRMTALAVAAAWANAEAAVALLDAGASVSAGAPAPLLACALAQCGEPARMVRYVLRRSSGGRSWSRRKIFNELLRRGASPFAAYDGKPATFYLDQWLQMKLHSLKRNTDAIIHMPMAESEDEPSDDDSDARDEYYENRLDRLRMQTRLIYEGYDVKELSQSINLMSQTMHAMYTGAPLPAAGFLPLVTKEEDA